MSIETFVIWIVLGGVIGWIASLVIGGEQRDLLIDIVVGIAGAFIAGLLFNSGNINQGNFSIQSIIASFFGAVILLFILYLIRRLRARGPQ